MQNWRKGIGEALADVKAAVTIDEPLAGCTTFGIGGPADAVVEVADEPALVRVLAFCREAGVDWYVLGRGSNVLISDQGLRGVIVRLGRGFAEVEVEGEAIRVGGAAPLDGVAVAAEQAGLCGAEFLAGIPGTVGGGMRTNAGAFGRSLTDLLETARVMNHEGDVRELDRSGLADGYRNPVVAGDMVVLDAVLRLASGKPEPAEAIRQRRWAKQPQDPSAGSFFKNPPTEPAGRLIDRCGLKGTRIGGARVSEKHANFIINTGGASFAHVCELAQVVKANVEEKTGVVLDEEVQVLPRVDCARPGDRR